ncbi:lysozyme inhibitor LprI family protein [Oryzifoliimicrobium ureilyticus]|uniref:lysozyme inhibitor LprI family protein n=1 Tax=Oryzifoliimicrobium ureilyticus TaxID=3113724 RepID=UPI0030766B8A
MASLRRVMGLPFYLVILAVFFIGMPPAMADGDPHSCAGPGPNGPGALVELLQHEKTCQAALKTLWECQWGSSADTAFSAVVVGKCESSFFDRLSSSAQRNYAARMELCAYRYARVSGTLFMSMAAFCQAQEAASTASNPALADKPLDRASFDCTKAESPIEKTICASPSLGKADLVLGQEYRDALKSVTNEDRAQLVADEKAWLERITSQCKPNETASPTIVACLRNAFEIRFSTLINCGEGGNYTPECLDDDSSVKPGDDAKERASFDCDSPSTAIEIAICADAALGQVDIEMAAAYQKARDRAAEDHRKVLLDSQRKWLFFVEKSCPLGAIGGIPPLAERACIRSAYQERIVQLNECPQANLEVEEQCLDSFRLVSQDAKEP